tara:strand:+ start:103 stop:210 length:108 start_codon:yes stop_codon:yes gene_type:complete
VYKLAAPTKTAAEEEEDFFWSEIRFSKVGARIHVK